MNKKLPFEKALQRQINNLPLPQEDGAWQKMLLLLDDEDKQRPLVFFKDYRVLASLALLLAFSIGLTIHFKRVYKSTALTDKKLVVANQDTESPLRLATNNGIASLKTIDQVSTPKRIKLNEKMISDSVMAFKRVAKTITKKLFLASKSNKFNSLKSTTGKIIARGKYAQTGRLNFAKKHLAIRIPIVKAAIPDLQQQSDTSISANLKRTDLAQLVQLNIQKPILNDFTNKLTDTTKNQIDNTSGSAEIVNQADRYIITAGVGEQQQIPIAGQQLVHYGYDANSTISDYLPFVYFTFENERRWFVQAGFSYGVPQLVKEFSYSRQTVKESANAYSTTTLKLRKTFYNQIPISFNYYVRPALSIGFGGIYNWFHGAIINKETTTSDSQTQAKSTSTEVVPITAYTDSFLYKSHTYLFLQTNYHWRKFSAGVRYAKDMQPYIKYTLPDGTVNSRKNWALEFVLRFQLWKSGQL